MDLYNEDKDEHEFEWTSDAGYGPFKTVVNIYKEDDNYFVCVEEGYGDDPDGVYIFRCNSKPTCYNFEYDGSCYGRMIGKNNIKLLSEALGCEVVLVRSRCGNLWVEEPSQTQTGLS